MAMTKAGSSVSSDALVSWSPAILTNPAKIPRRHVRIPSDQQKLLNRPDAWSLGRYPNVPQKVLAGVRAQSVRDIRPNVSAPEETFLSQPASSASPGRGEEDIRRSVSPARGVGTGIEPGQNLAKAEDSNREEEEEGKEGKEREEGGEDIGGTCIPWSSSPPEHFLRPRQREELQARAVNDPSGDSPKQRAPKTIGRFLAREAFVADFPPSSSATSDQGLEIEVPKPATEALEPVNRQAVAVFNYTPPSAQVIPCTLTEKPSPAKEPQPKRRRLMKPVAYDSPIYPAGQEADSRSTLPGSRCASPSQPSRPNISPSPTKSARQDRPGEASPVAPSVENQDDLVSGHRPGVAKVAVSLQPTGEHGSSEFPVKTPWDTSSSQTPYTVFKAAYPDYRGTLGDYLRALLSISSLRKKRALAEFLYDDFVRVFSTDYLGYISSQEGNSRPLSAVEFYNENVSRPVYLRGVLTKDNIREILGNYSDRMRAMSKGEEPGDATSQRPGQRAPDQAPFETQTARQAPRKTETSYASHESESSSAAVPASPRPGTREARSPVVPTFAAAEPSPARQAREAVPPPTTDIDVFPPPPTVRPLVDAGRPANEAATVPSSRPAFRTQPDSFSLDIEPSPTPVVDRFSGACLSQASNPESIPETTLRRRVAPRASTGSSAAEPGAPFKRPQAAKTSADKRALRFKKFLMQKKIQSSAPEQSTP
ncbi:hypothetical protein VTH06DRAFT_624 [Thermothelomyces fergusii]